MPERMTQDLAPKSEAKELRRELGAWLKRKREKASLTQTQLASMLGLKHPTYVSLVENGAGRIPQDLYSAWADALGVDRFVFAMKTLQYLEPGLCSEIVDRLHALSAMISFEDCDIDNNNP